MTTKPMKQSFYEETSVNYNNFNGCDNLEHKNFLFLPAISVCRTQSPLTSVQKST